MRIEEMSLQVSDVGNYEIKAKAHFSNSTYSENFETTFTLSIGYDRVPDAGPQNILSVSEWTQE